VYEKTLATVTVYETKAVGRVVNVSCQVEVVTAFPSASLNEGRLNVVVAVKIAVTLMGEAAANDGALFVTVTLNV